ncbi:MAG: cobalamin-dependent protein [Clostridia bacterium]|nr:cobalamin-dependent protein [Clostridia bacterium]
MTVNDTKPLRIAADDTEKYPRISQETAVFKRVYDGDSPFRGLHTNDIIEIGLVVSGSGILRILDNAIPCKEGDIFVIRPDSPHGFFTSEIGDVLTVRRLWFDAHDWFDGAFSDPDDPRFCYGVFSDNSLMTYAVLTASIQNEINQFCNAIALETEEQKSEWREAVRANLSMMLITIGRYVGRAIKNLPTALPKKWSVVSEVMRQVNERIGDSELTLNTIASSLYISASHLSRLFKECTGETFAEYLRRTRLSHACALLKETDLTVEEIARQCGKKDIPSFYQSFFVYKGVTPNQYRIQKNKEKKKGDTHMSILNEISENLQKGKAKIVKELVQQALDEGVSAELILNDGLMHGMNIIGEKFKNNEIYVPEVLVAARAMNMGAQILKPHLAASGVKATGRVCIGTVQGDLHDIGKNLVKMMLEGKGLEVVDLGTDVSAETFVKTAIEQECQVICCSALLTTTMGVMADVVKEAEKAGIRDKVKIMIGGAPVNEEFCREIGADCYTVDAASAADAAVAFCKA